MPIGIGIIGLSASSGAWATQIHLGAIRSLPNDYTLVALSTSSQESALAAGKAHGVPPEKCYASADALAKDPDVELVLVAVKTPHHKELLLPAINAGKNVFVEWPVANGIEEVNDLVKASKEKGVKTIVGVQGRQVPAFRKAKELIESGVLGKIVSSTTAANTQFFANLNERNEYEADASNGANVVTIFGGHVLDVIAFILGEFKSVQATVSKSYKQANIYDEQKKTIRLVDSTSPDQLAVQGVLQNGASLSLHLNCVSLGIPEYFIWYIHGEKASLKLEHTSASLATIFPPTLYLGKDNKWEEVKVDAITPIDPFVSIYKAFAEGNTAGYTDFESASVRHRLLEAIFKSAKDGTVQTYVQ